MGCRVCSPAGGRQRCTSWSAPKRAAPASAPSSQSLRPNSGAFRSVSCWCALSRFASSPAPSVPVLESLGPNPRASPLCFCQRGSPDSLPFPGVCSAEAPRQGGPRERNGNTPRAATPTPAQLLAGLGNPGSRWLSCRRTAVPRRQEEARPAPGLGGTTPGQWVSGCARAVPL